MEGDDGNGEFETECSSVAFHNRLRSRPMFSFYSLTCVLAIERFASIRVRRSAAII